MAEKDESGSSTPTGDPAGPPDKGKKRPDARWGEWLQDRLKGHARGCKIVAQMMIGAWIAGLLLLQALHHAGLWPDQPAWLGESHPLALVSLGLGIASGFELAYLLFTPGPDEAVSPLMLGFAAAALLLVSRIDDPELGYSPLLIAGAALTLVIGIAILAVVRLLVPEDDNRKGGSDG